MADPERADRESSIELHSRLDQRFVSRKVAAHALERLGEGKSVGMGLVQASEGKAELPPAHRNCERQTTKDCEVTLFQLHALFRQREREETACVWIEAVVDHDLGLARAESDSIAVRVVGIAGDGRERLADDRDLRIENAGGDRRSAGDADAEQQTIDLASARAARVSMERHEQDSSVSRGYERLHRARGLDDRPTTGRARFIASNSRP